MQLFGAVLILLFVAVVLLQASRRLRVPYPAMLAVAGGAVAAIPWAPQLTIEPHLALTLFIAPALLDAAFDTSPRELLRNWLPLVSLVVFAVLLTTAAVGFVGWYVAGLPVAAAIALGAIVAPPDAAAAAAVLAESKLPRRMTSVLQGESLLNDSVALLIFAAAVAAVGAPGGTSLIDSSAGSMAAATASATASAVSAVSAAASAALGAGGSAAEAAVPLQGQGASVLSLVMAVPGGIVVGVVLGKIFIKLVPLVAGTLSSTIVEFVATFGVWLLAERLGVSAILAIVAYAMVIATYMPSRTRARDRVHSYAVWNAVVFVLNVMAFLLMGLQARVILARLDGASLWSAVQFSLLVLAVVVVSRLAWVMTYGYVLRLWKRRSRHAGEALFVPSVQQGVMVSWCGMRGLVTLATAFALPVDFPGRDVIVLSAFMVVLGTLVLQGLTIAPLMRLLKIAPDESFLAEISQARTTMLDAALASIGDAPGAEAAAVKSEYQAARQVAADERNPQALTRHEDLRMTAINAQRKVLNELRDGGQIDDDVYHRLEEELDWSELAVAPSNQARILTT